MVEMDSHFRRGHGWGWNKEEIPTYYARLSRYLKLMSQGRYHEAITALNEDPPPEPGSAIGKPPPTSDLPF